MCEAHEDLLQVKAVSADHEAAHRDSHVSVLVMPHRDDGFKLRPKFRLFALQPRFAGVDEKEVRVIRIQRFLFFARVRRLLGFAICAGSSGGWGRCLFFGLIDGWAGLDKEKIGKGKYCNNAIKTVIRALKRVAGNSKGVTDFCWLFKDPAQKYRACKDREGGFKCSWQRWDSKATDTVLIFTDSSFVNFQVILEKLIHRVTDFQKLRIHGCF